MRQRGLALELRIQVHMRVQREHGAYSAVLSFSFLPFFFVVEFAIDGSRARLIVVALCRCPLLGPVVQTREHISRSCPLYEACRSIPRKKFPRLDDPRFSLASLFKPGNPPTLLDFMAYTVGAFTKRGIPWNDRAL